MTFFNVTSATNTTLKLAIDDTSETLDCMNAIEVACQLGAAHAELVSSRSPSINFGYGNIKTEMNAKQVFELSMTMQIVAIPLGNASMDGGWTTKAGRSLLDHLEKAASNMAMAESMRAGKAALNDLSTMSGREHLAGDALYQQFLQVVESAQGKKNTDPALDKALLDACQNGQLGAVKDALAKGADANAKGSFGITALIKAISLGHLEIANELLTHGADVDATNNNEETALLHASQGGHVEMVNALLSRGADVNAKGNIGGTALMIAAHFGRLDVVKALIAGGAQLDAKNIDGTSALFMAAANNHSCEMKALLDNGADVNATMNDGFTALMKASQRGVEAVRVLLAHRATVDTRNDRGYTALMLASAKGHTVIVEDLIRHAADVNARNNNGDTALYLAGSDRVRALLLNAGAQK